jgi:hypothetical protein
MFSIRTLLCRLLQSPYPKVPLSYLNILYSDPNLPEDGDDSEDDDVEIGGVTQDHKCPLTLTILVDPMTA